jgi:hypothetical protein
MTLLHFALLFVGAMAGAGGALAVCVLVLYSKQPRIELPGEDPVRLDLTSGDEASIRALRRNALRLVKSCA